VECLAEDGHDLDLVRWLKRRLGRKETVFALRSTCATSRDKSVPNLVTKQSRSLTMD
jgi:hypothetical protein